MNAQPQPLTEEFLRALQEQQAQRSGSTIFTTHTNPNWPYKYATYSVNPTSPEHARAIFELLGMVTTHTQQNPSSTFTLIHHLTSIGISAVGPGGFLAAIASVTGITLTRAHFTNEYLPELFNTLEKFAISINRVPAATLLAMTKAFIISKTTTYTPQTFVIALLDFCTKQFSTIPSNVLATTPLISHMLDAISDTLLRKEVILLLDAIYGRTIYGNPRPGVNYDPQPIFQLPSGASFNPAEYKNALGLEALQALAARLLTAACGDDPRVPPRFFEENFLSLRSNKTSSRGGAASEPTPPQASPSDKASQPCVIPGHKGSHTNGECNAQKALCENPLCNRAGRHKRVNHTAGECHRGFYLKTRETPTSSTPTARVAAVQPAPTSTPVTVAAAPQAGGGGGSGSASAPTCNYCKEPGHLIADCSKRKAKDEAREKAGLPPYVPKRSQTPGTRASSTPRARGPGGPLVTAGLFAAAATLPAPGSGFSIYLPWANISTDFCYNPVPYAANYTIASTSTGPGSLMMQMACPGPECEGTIFGHPVKTTLDSGASISVMPANVLYAIQRASPFNLKVTPCSPLDRIATAFGTLVPQEELVGTVDLPLHVIYNITPAGLPTSNVEFCQSVRFLVIKYPDSQTPPPIYIGGKSLLEESMINSMFISILDPKIHVEFPIQLGPLTAVEPLRVGAADAITPGPLHHFTMPGDDIDFCAHNFSDAPNLKDRNRHISFEEIYNSTEASCPLDPELQQTKAQWIYDNQTSLLGHFPPVCPMPLVDIPQKGPPIKRGLQCRIPARLHAATIKEADKWIDGNIWAVIPPEDRHRAINVFHIVCQEKGIDKNTGLRKEGLRLTMDCSPLSPYYRADYAGGQGVTNMERFYDTFRRCYQLGDLDYYSFFNTPSLTEASSYLFCAVLPNGVWVRSLRPPQGFILSGTISTSLLWEHVLAPIQTANSALVQPISIPAFPPPGTLPLSSDSRALPECTAYEPIHPSKVYVDNLSFGYCLPPGVTPPEPGSPEYKRHSRLQWENFTRPLMELSAKNGFRFTLNSTNTTDSKSRNLGVVLSDGHRLDIDPTRISGITNFTVPPNVRISDVRSVRGLLLSFARFVNSTEFTQLIKLFTDVITTSESTGTLCQSLWNSTHDRALARCKDLIASAMSLYVHDPTLHYYLRTDASNPADGSPGAYSYLLFQYHPTLGYVCPIAVGAKCFTPIQATYTTKDKELFALTVSLRALEKLKLPCTNIILTTDHNNLTSWNSSVGLRASSWVSELVSRNCHIQHIPGAANQPADALSRLPLSESPHDTHPVAAVLPLPPPSSLPEFPHFPTSIIAATHSESISIHASSPSLLTHPLQTAPPLSTQPTSKTVRFAIDEDPPPCPPAAHALPHPHPCQPQPVP